MQKFEFLFSYSTSAAIASRERRSRFELCVPEFLSSLTVYTRSRFTHFSFFICRLIGRRIIESFRLNMEYSRVGMAPQRITAIPYRHYVPLFQIVAEMWAPILGLIVATIGIVAVVLVWHGHEVTGLASEVNTILAALGIVLKGSMGSILGVSLYQLMWENAARDGMTFR
jgi:small-conductance mechanosensitive channel